MTDFGICPNLAYEETTPSVQHLTTGGVSLVRSISYPATHDRVIDLAKRYWFEAGAQTSIVLTSQSLGAHWLSQQDRFLANLEDVARRVVDRGAKQCVTLEYENELDNPAWGHSWNDILDFCNRACVAVKHHGVKAGGMAVLGGPAEGLFELLYRDPIHRPDYANIHIYGRSLGGYPYPGWNFGTVEDACDEIAQRTSIPTRITETGVYTQVAGSFSWARQRGYWQAAKAFEHPAIDAVCCFNLYDKTVPQEELDEGKDFGIITVNEVAKSAYRAIFPGVSVHDHAQPLDGGAPVFEFVLGFKEFHDAAPELIGDATENEHPFYEGATGWQMQRTTKGMLQWVTGEGKSFLGYDGRLYVWPEGHGWYFEV